MAKVDVPYLKRRGNHFRWEPGPMLRAKGAKGVTLRDAAGNFLNEQDAIAQARALNDAVASGAALAAPRVHGPRTVKAMFDALRTAPKFTAGGDVRNRLAARTRRSYLSHLAMIEQWCGDIPAAALTPAQVENYYDRLVAARGLAQANAMMRTFKLAFNYAIKKLRWACDNPVSAIEMGATEGRLVLWSVEEIAAVVACADWMGRESVADAVILGALTGQREGDLLRLAVPEFVNGALAIRQSKTGRRAFVPPTEPLTQRLAKMAERKAARWPNVAFAHAVVDAEGKAYLPEGTGFRHEFADVRAMASGAVFAIADALRALGGLPPLLRNLPFTPQPSLLGKRFQDLRDTAVTMLFGAGCTVGEIANITGHSLKTVQDILDKHYFVRNEALAVSAGVKLQSYLGRIGL